ncbi:plasmid partition protein ParG [Scytonema sp. NUACC21]
MHISIADDLKKRFHAACAIRGLKMSQVITELIQQWLEKLTAKAVSPANSLIGLALGDSSRRLSEMSKV